jgi:mRNA interferase HigB
VQERARSFAEADGWVKLVEAAQWKTTADVKATFGGNVDFVGSQTVFDVGGNKYRLVTRIDYPTTVVLVTFAGDHGEYDKGKWRR